MPDTPSVPADRRLPLSRRDFLASAAAGAALGGLSLSSGEQPKRDPSAQSPSSPLAMWALTGTLQRADVSRQLDAYREVGWGVVLYPRWGLELEYLGGEWFDRIRFITAEAAAREMEVWLYDEFCWPSGHAKGLVTKDRGDLAAELLEVEPDGQSRVVRVLDSANLLLPEATQRFLEVTHQRYAAAIGEYFGRCVRAIFTDEPSLAMQHAPRPPGAASWQLAWSPAMDAALDGDFRQRLASASDLPRWSGWRDYWAAYSQVFHDCWVMPLAAWCRAHRVALTGHLLGEHSFGAQVAYNGSLRRQLGEFGIPGIDEIHTRPDPRQCEALTLAAIAELAGRERMVEVYALGPPHMTLATMRKMVDLCAACGVDRFVLAICPHDLRGGVFKREYLGIHGPQQPWFRDFARVYADYVAEAAQRARQAKPLGVPWPSDQELWAAAGPDPKRSAALQRMTEQVVAAAREAIRDRLDGTSATVPALISRESPEPAWSFQPRPFNSLRLDHATLDIEELPARAELSVQAQLVRSLRINGTAVDWRAAPADEKFDLSYRRVSIVSLLRVGENQFALETAEPKPLKFLPALILWGDFAVDPHGRLVAPPATIPLGDWRQHGYPALCGTGCYRAVTDFSTPPTSLAIDTGGFPARVLVNGKEIGRRAWPPFDFDLRGTAQSGRNEIIIEITSTVGHLFAAAESPPIGLLAAKFGTPLSRARERGRG